MTTSAILTDWISEKLDEAWDEILRESVELACTFDGWQMYRHDGLPELSYDVDEIGEMWAEHYAELSCVDRDEFAGLLDATTIDDWQRAYVETITGDGLANGDTAAEALLWHLLADGFRTVCNDMFTAYEKSRGDY